MSFEPLPISSIGEPLPYSDGAEAELLKLFRTVEDRRVGSDELASAVRDWPTAYHLAPERAVLLAPVVIGPDDRVLDVGAGSGVNTRICADRGAAVTAVEGSAARAELIAHRCAGLKDVRVLCGPLEGLGDDDRGAYDVVLLVGVLEYASTGQGGGEGPEALLTRAVDALAPGGVLVLAIENRLGLKYLLGFPEDHLGLPWVSWEGYRPGEPTTWSRRELARMLADAGLAAQRWLYPFPDYKLPTAVLAEEIYDRPDAVDMVDQVVGHPTTSEYFHPVLVADDRAAHRALLTAGLGPDVANSFLVVAGRSPQAVAERVDHRALAWRVAPDRRRRWRQQAVVVDSEQGLIMKRRLMAEDRASDFEEWLGQAEVAEEAYFEGRNLEQCLLESARENNTDEIAKLLGAWRSELAAHETPIDSVAAPHPYLPADAMRALPPDWLDAGPDNFVVTADDLKFVDREWLAAGGVDVRLAVVRGLWKTVSAMLSARCHLPWPTTWSNDRLVAHLGTLIGEDIDEGLMKQWRQAEDELVRLVYRQPAARLAELHDAGSRSRMDLLASPMAPYRRMEHLVHRQQELIAQLTEQHETAASLEEAQARFAQAEAQLAELQIELADAQARLSRVAWRERIHNRIAALIRGFRTR
ncbi:MAG: methyltransferase domain-containing protein [Acidimicrobiia bacterium]|nr:methyltransferase domain-containing protein [Acidimicrobiia bacterium]MXZ85539.1 methyltransferase domain-containing protein [Acidimicrobiia bacterium]MYE73666.1 methyltransferase domain-containing protein [Acidimicrobiia bacterium]MYG71285.1 methyltransferase domain-containing protein [Acidimicrobiia bacterium]MYJ61084.1 methyltransferase domain-containing protein [Acidimicrobiia bacterium]